MDDRWESEVIEYGAINITGFRIVDNSRRMVREFLEGWRKVESGMQPSNSAVASRETISVRVIKFL
jgi:glutamate receptor, ionotropic, invertebrate